MDEAQARQIAEGILGPAVVALLTDTDWPLSLERATVDGDTDPWILAAELADLLGIRSQAGGVTEYTSEGTTVKRTTADWFSMAAALRAKSARVIKSSGIGVVSIDTGGGYAPKPMGWDGYWTWDADGPVFWPWVSPELP